MRIVCIVEGHGEVAAMPVLVRRIAMEVAPDLRVQVPHPIRVARSKLLREGGVEKAVELAARQSQETDAILVVIDADDDCPAEVAAQLYARIRIARPDRVVRVVLPKCEFEAWFIAASESLRGKRRLRDDLCPPEDPESIRDAKGWLGRQTPEGQRYRETIDQPALTAEMDMGAARKAPSFDKLWRDVASVLVE